VTLSSRAQVATSRPDRYAKQLAAHLGRKHGGEWSEAERTGWVQFTSGRAGLAASDGLLTVTLRAETGATGELQDVISRHLVRFAGDDALQVHWTAEGSDPAVAPPL
jgi:hypothetical protein